MAAVKNGVQYAAGIILLFLGFFPVPAIAGTPLIRSNPATYDFVLGASFYQAHGTLEYLDCCLPIVGSDPYQDVSGLRYDQGRIQIHPENGAKYFYDELVSRGMRRRDPRRAEIAYSARVTLYDVTMDFAALSIHSYHESSKIYRRYVAPNGKYIVPRHPRIAPVADKLSSRGDSYVDFARKAYEYVAKNFEYAATEGELAELDEIMARKGGNSAELSSIYISLLRYRGIPARHVVARTQQGELHVFAEFYLEGEGWIPVDVTYRNWRPQTDYFGRKYGRDRLVVVSRDIMLSVAGTEKTRTVPFLYQFDYTHRIGFLPNSVKDGDFYKMRTREIFGLSPIR